MTKNEFINNMQLLIDAYKNNNDFKLSDSIANKTDDVILTLLKDNYMVDNGIFTSCEDIKYTIKVLNISNRRLGALIKSLYSDIKKKQSRIIADNKLISIMSYNLKPIKEKEVEEVKQKKGGLGLMSSYSNK